MPHVSPANLSLRGAEELPRAPAPGSESRGERLGVFVIGARGSVATTAIVGATAIARGLHAANGMMTAAAELAALPLPGLDRLVFGGNDIRSGRLSDQAGALAAGGVLPAKTAEAVRDVLDECDTRIVPGHLHESGEAIEELARADARAAGDDRGSGGDRGNGGDQIGESEARTGRTPAEIVAELQADLDAFRENTGVTRLLLLNLASTEPTQPAGRALGTLEELRAAIESPTPGDVIPLSSLQAFAALDRGIPYVNFTPSTGAALPALEELSRLREVPHAGRDGKTGETLLKTVLAPMFVARQLRILSWQGYNMLGNRDGAVLKAPENLASKVKSKDMQLRSILGLDAGDRAGTDDLHTGVRIDYVPSLGEWKTAWDFIHFEGFLGTRMELDFTWRGCDSTLAAPLVLDLIRLVDLAHRRGESGALSHLACFFKDPHGTEVHDFGKQVEMLHAYAEKCGTGGEHAAV